MFVGPTAGDGSLCRRGESANARHSAPGCGAITGANRGRRGELRTRRRSCSCHTGMTHVVASSFSSAPRRSAPLCCLRAACGRANRPKRRRSALRHDRADRLLADRHRAREGLLQEVRHQLDGRARARAGRRSATRSRNGDIQATHMLLGMPIASTMGLLGSPKKPMVIPWMLNRNGQAITLKAELQGQGQRRSQGAQAARRRGQGRGHADDVRDDVPARHARDVDALLPRRRRHPSRQGRRARSPSRRRRWWRT